MESHPDVGQDPVNWVVSNQSVIIDEAHKLHLKRQNVKSCPKVTGRLQLSWLIMCTDGCQLQLLVSVRSVAWLSTAAAAHAIVSQVQAPYGW